MLAAALMMCSAADALAQGRAQERKKPTTFNVLPLTITSVTPQNGQLFANGVLGSTAFQLPLVLRPQALVPGATCPILDLSLGPINSVCSA